MRVPKGLFLLVSNLMGRSRYVYLHCTAYRIEILMVYFDANQFYAVRATLARRIIESASPGEVYAVCLELGHGPSVLVDRYVQGVTDRLELPRSFPAWMWDNAGMSVLHVCDTMWVCCGGGKYRGATYVRSLGPEP